MKYPRPNLLLTLFAFFAPSLLCADIPAVPDWAQPGSATHHQVPPPADFRRATTTYATPIGRFTGQSDIGTAVVPGSAVYDDATGSYTIHSAGYNIWYFRDEFRYLWTKMSGDLSLAANIRYPDSNGYGDRKAVLVLRQDLDDDSKEVMVALHGAGLIHLAGRPDKGTDIKEACRVPAQAAGILAQRIGIEKHGDVFALYVSEAGEPMHMVGQTLTLHLQEPYYVGIGFTSHLPATADTAILTNLVLENASGQVR